MRLASTEVMRGLAEYGHTDIDQIMRFWAHLAAQKLLGPLPTNAGARLRTNAACRHPGCSGAPHGPGGSEWDYWHGIGVDISALPAPQWPYSDPTGEAAASASARLHVEHLDQRAQLAVLDALDRLHQAAAAFEHSLELLRRAREALVARCPAGAAAANGRPPRALTDGRTQDEIERKKRGAVEAESACLACDLGVTQVGRLRGGLCDRDRKRWERDGKPDRPIWVVRRRAEVAAELEGSLGAQIIPLRPSAIETDQEAAA